MLIENEKITCKEILIPAQTYASINKAFECLKPGFFSVIYIYRERGFFYVIYIYIYIYIERERERERERNTTKTN